MRGLFSLLFGASMLLVIERAEAKDENPAEIHYRRMAWLLVFGFRHLFLIWSGDILSHYALVGMIAYLFRDKPADSLVKWALAFILIEIALVASSSIQFVTIGHEAATAAASADILRQWENMKSAFGPLPPAELAVDLALHRGGYGAILADRLHSWPSIVNSLHYVGPETLGYMLLGMAGLKSGFLTGQWDLSRYRRWALLCYAVSVPVFALLALSIILTGFDPAWVVALGLGATTPIRPVMIVGMAALVIILTRRGGPLVARIAAAGRAAFSNYIGTSLVMTGIFYGYGLGYYGHMGRAQLYLVVIAMWVLILLWSKPWLDHYLYGPLEWLWRTLARWSPQPMRTLDRE
jgi:uncharacterized protein